MTLEEILSVRPESGQPRTYTFPHFTRTVLPSGMQVLVVEIPGRPLVTANLIVRRGVCDEPAELAGATALMARAMTEGTERYPGVELIEAAERLGATLGVDANWDSFFASVDVAASRLPAAIALLAELVEHPTFPEADVARLREERLNDLLQVKADPRRRVDQAFTSAIYAAGSPYGRPAGGDETTVAGLTPDGLRQVHRTILDPGRTALIVGGDLTTAEVLRAVGAPDGLTSETANLPADPTVTAPPVAPGVDRPIVRLYHRPGSVQSEVRMGHVGLPRRTPDFYAVQVMAAILGGLFNSRLQMNLREDKGYTYGVGAGFDMRRGAGPFSVRTAVQTSVTVPAIAEALKELSRMRETLVTDAELVAARDFMVGVFPLRFETPGAVVGAVGGLFAGGLPDDELARYRDRIEAVTAEDVRKAAVDHIRPDRMAIVVVGDAEAVAKDLEAAEFGEFEAIREEAAG